MKIDGSRVSVKGSKGTLEMDVMPQIKVEQEDAKLVVTRESEIKTVRAAHGMTRAILNNMVTGVTKGFEVKLELIGVGFRVEQLPNNVLDLVLGYSHHIYLQLPPEITLEAKTEKRTNPYILMKCIDKQLLGQVAAKIRSFRKPEPYNGKGIKFVDEQLRRKAGKAAGVK